MSPAGHIGIAGAGIAGLTCALAFAEHGFRVSIYERASRLDEVGAGLQLSPNATRILARLGLLPAIEKLAVEPCEIELRRAANLRRVASVPLGRSARARWDFPYLTIHRADLQAVLLEAVRAHGRIALHTGTTVVPHTQIRSGQPTMMLETAEGIREERFMLVVAADGVWSRLRASIPGAGANSYTGYVAWRAVLEMHGNRAGWLPPTDRVTTFLHPRFHLVAYPLHGGDAVNLVVLSKGHEMATTWSNDADAGVLATVMRGCDPRLSTLVEAGAPWTAWPLHEVRTGGRWIAPEGIALVGDAAHALTPFAAQGAAMAIEDAFILAGFVVQMPSDIATALTRYEALRKPRVERVARRGAFNRFAWNAAGPIAFGRDIVLALRPPRALADDMNWLYAWDAEAALAT